MSMSIKNLKSLSKKDFIAAGLVIVSLSYLGCLTLDRPVMGHDRNPPSNEAGYKVSIVTFGETKRASMRPFFRDKKGRADLMWAFWLLEGDGKKIIVDPGVGSEQTAEGLGIQSYVRPDVALRETGIAPKEVTHVLLTHFHAHSAEAVTLFPDAEFYVQSSGYERARMRVHRKQGEKKGIAPETIAFLEQKEKEGKVVRMDTTFEVLRGVKVHANYLHTRWYNYFSINTKGGTYVIPGSIVPYWENVERNVGMPDDSEKVYKRTYETMRALTGGNLIQIVPAVDPKIKSEYKKISAHVYGVTG